ncbi:MAG: DEAD/DEAH box helicase family protein [Deltaproteobacteria bacterium]|nr:DEAD/DEAH box helicase family protein [Deltaproteobacteria bacterium]
MQSDQDKATGFRSLKGIRPIYFLPSDPFSEQVLVPTFRISEKADCMMGFFSSEALSTIAPGLAAFINSSKFSFRLIISPFLRPEDREAIESGIQTPEDVAKKLVEPILITEDELEQHTLKCLSYLIRAKRIEIKIALMKSALFHPKVWIFKNSGDLIAAHGSSNITLKGIKHNFEQITISKSWIDSTQSYIIKKFRNKFDRLWDNQEDSCFIVTIPQAVRDKLLSSYPSEHPPTESEYLSLYLRAMEKISGDSQIKEIQKEWAKFTFNIPEWIRYEAGPFEHQGKAVVAWCLSGHRGVLEMATGSGKTITAMICAYKAYEKNKPLLIVIAAPYIPLINQWSGEIGQFNVKTTNLTEAGNAAGRLRMINQIKRRLRTGISNVEAVVVTHNTLCSEDFYGAISSFDCPRLLVADEAHNLGRISFIGNTPDYYEFRLALSATPVRQYDEEGTEAIFDFFGPVVYRFTLKEAIGKCLVEYDYHVHPCHLSPTEMDQWYDLTEKIKKSAWRTEDGKPDDYLAKLYRDRRELLETIESKIVILASLLDGLNLKDLRYTLIYGSDKEPEQLEQINGLLRDRGVLFHQLTFEETANRQKTKNIIQSFQQGEIQILTAKRVLDEGVNIPQICQAFILASTTVERQWVQRRGRLLRTCSAINKNHSIIHDFIALPPDLNKGMDSETRSLIRSELSRIHEFASIARNAGRPDGPLEIIDELVNSAYL